MSKIPGVGIEKPNHLEPLPNTLATHFWPYYLSHSTFPWDNNDADIHQVQPHWLLKYSNDQIWKYGAQNVYLVLFIAECRTLAKLVHIPQTKVFVQSEILTQTVTRNLNQRKELRTYNSLSSMGSVVWFLGLINMDTEEQCNQELNTSTHFCLTHALYTPTQTYSQSAIYLITTLNNVYSHHAEILYVHWVYYRWGLG